MPVANVRRCGMGNPEPHSAPDRRRFHAALNRAASVSRVLALAVLAHHIVATAHPHHKIGKIVAIGLVTPILAAVATTRPGTHGWEPA